MIKKIMEKHMFKIPFLPEYALVISCWSSWSGWYWSTGMVSELMEGVEGESALSQQRSKTTA